MTFCLSCLQTGLICMYAVGIISSIFQACGCIPASSSGEVPSRCACHYHRAATSDRLYSHLDTSQAPPAPREVHPTEEKEGAEAPRVTKPTSLGDTLGAAGSVQPQRDPDSNARPSAMGSIPGVWGSCSSKSPRPLPGTKVLG